MKYSNTLNWPVDGLDYQKQVRSEWEPDSVGTLFVPTLLMQFPRGHDKAVLTLLDCRTYAAGKHHV